MSLFRLLMRAYPAEFRRRYGEELDASFRAIRGEPQHAGALGRLRFWAFVFRDLLSTAIRLRLRQFSTRSRPSLPARTSRTEMDTILQDVWYALRQFGRRPGFAAVAVLSLGLAIGANSLIYGLVQGLVLHPFPYPDPDRLVAVGVGFPRISDDRQLRRGPVAGRIRGHSSACQLLRVGRGVRSREPQHLRWRRSRAGLHGTAARRSVPRDRHGAAARPRLHAGRARARRGARGDHQQPALAHPLRRRSRESSAAASASAVSRRPSSA